MSRTQVRSAILALCIALVGAIAVKAFHSHSQTPARIISATAAPVDAHQAQPILQMYEQAPLTFEENRGQTDSRVRFLSRGQGYALFLTDEAAVLSLRSKQGKAATVRIRPAQPSAAMTIEAEGRSATVSNYLIGKDPKAWRRGVAQYERVRYRNAYPGVDLVYYGNQRELEHDFVLAPGADPRGIRIKIEGAERLATNQHGDLVLHTAAGEALLKRPDIYQKRDGARETISGAYRIIAPDMVSFNVGHYDSARSLVIDPVLSYSTLLGGGDIDTGMAIAVDAAGSAYVTGNATSRNFPVTSNAYDQICGNDGTCLTGSGKTGDAFVAKISLTGTRMYVTYLGGGDTDVGYGIKVDTAGNAYVSGVTYSNDFPGTTIGTVQDNALHSFVTKVAPDGGSLVYSVRFANTPRGGSSGKTVIGIDAAGNATVTGTAEDFPATAGALQAASAGGSDAFVARLNAAGTAFLWGTYLGGSGNDTATGLALDSDGNAYLAGFTNSSNFPTTAGSLKPAYNSADGTGFVTKIKNDGSALVYSTFLGGTQGDFAGDIAIDSSRNAYVAGGTSSPDFPVTAGAYSTTYHCGINCAGEGFVSKLNSTGSGLIYSTFLPSTSPGSIAVDGAGQAYVGGSVLTQDFSIVTTMTAFQRVAGRPSDGFLIKLNPTGSGFIYSSYIGGKGSSYLNGLALDANGNAFLTGYTNSTAFPTTPGAFQTTNAAGDNDAFIARAVSLCALDKTNPSVTMCQPSDGATVTSPVTIVAGTFDNTRVKSMQVLVDGTVVYSANLSAVEIRWKMAAGPHTITVTATDTSGVTFQKSAAITVGP